MKELSFERMEELQGAKFWGSGDYYDATECDDGKKVICKDYYVFWIKVVKCWDDREVDC